MDEAQQIVDALRSQNATVATAESLTGGLVGQTLTEVSGSSAVYRGGVISYCNAVKEQLLGVDGQILATLGAVSQPVAAQMAQGVRALLHTDYAVSTTGIAGPNSDETGKPVGLVYIAVSGPQGTLVQQLSCSGSRQEIRMQSCQAVLQLLVTQLGSV